MPLYKYTCKDCGTQFEKMVRFSEAIFLPVCPNCHSENTQKQISSFATQGGDNPATSTNSSCGSSGRFS